MTFRSLPLPLLLFSLFWLPNQDRHILMVTRLQGGFWQTPRVVSFSGLDGDADPAFVEGGARMFFVSKRQRQAGPRVEDWDIWWTERREGSWSKPRNPGAPLNTDRQEISPSFTARGDLYFSSNREGGCGGFGRNDLYISFRGEDGSWSEPLNMGEGVNSPEIEYAPAVTPDGKYLFFTSYRIIEESKAKRAASYEDVAELYARPGSGLGDIYWIDAGIIEELGSRAAGG